MGKATLGTAPAAVKQHSHRRHAAKPASSSASATMPMATQPKAGKTSILRASHTPRSIRLACAPGSARRPKPRLGVPNNSMALSKWMVGPLALPEEHLPHTIYMDSSGHMHEKLEDGGFLYMDCSGHCHISLNDGGLLYLDRQGSCHKSLFDQLEENAAVTKQRRNSAPSNLQGLGLRSPRSAGSSNSPLMLMSDADLARLTRTAMKGHSDELRSMQSKPRVEMGRHQHANSMPKPSKSMRRAHNIGQPRRMN